MFVYMYVFQMFIIVLLYDIWETYNIYKHKTPFFPLRPPHFPSAVKDQGLSPASDTPIHCILCIRCLP